MYTPLNPKPDFNALEKEILRLWKEKDILNKSIKSKPADKTKTFYDGPITANGDPHNGHVLTFAMKDIIPRYWTMQGYRVDRSIGWDCQGLPVEYEIEKIMGFKQKSDIEEYGIENFNKLCRELVLKTEGVMIELEERIGRLTNSDEEFHTMDPSYIESVWWSLKEIYDKGFMYEGYKVVPYSTRAGTSLSAAEVAMGGYSEIVDPAVTVKFELVDEPGTYILAWTTTPWTLPTNFGLAVGEEIEYGLVEDQGRKYILAKGVIEKYFPGKQPLKTMPAAELIGKEYAPLFDYFLGKANSYKVFSGGHVTTETGTGVVHLAPYGAEDMEIFTQVGIEPIDVLDDQGDFTETIEELSGKHYKDANPQIIELLEQKGLLFKKEDYPHEVAMCWRTGYPLIYKPINSWYISTSKLREQLIANNNTINWVPAHFRDGRFGNWLAEIKDWGISRSRYWGTPLPIWKSPSGKTIIIGSFAELEKLSGKKLEDPHRPYVDEITFEHEGEPYTRIEDVLDVWYDSGSMPFARFHYPFENKELFKQKFPAQYIAEGVDQTRGWFYSLLAVSTALFDKAPFENVVVNGFSTDSKGVKQSKSKKNYDPPMDLISKLGADPLRFYFFSSPISYGEDAVVDETIVKQTVQEFVLPFWNIISYLTTYANLHSWEPRPELAYNDRAVWDDAHPWDHIPFDNIDNELDAWLLLTLQNTIGEVTAQLENYNLPKASRALREFLLDVSKWYIRRSRERFASGDIRAIEVLYYTMVEYAKLAAPFVPFVTEYFYQHLVLSKLSDEVESIHLTNYPVVDNGFIQEYSQLGPEMEIVRQISELGQSIRTTSGIKLRQPLGKAEVNFDTKLGVSLSPWMKLLLEEELNIEEVIEVPVLSSGEKITVASNASRGVSISVNTNITPELAEAGFARELIRTIQAKRKEMGLEMGQEVTVHYSTLSPIALKVIENQKEKIATAVNAAEIVDGEAFDKVIVQNEEVAFRIIS